MPSQTRRIEGSTVVAGSAARASQTARATFATTISPWIVTQAALEPFRTSTPDRKNDLLPYLAEPTPMLFDIDLSASIAPAGKSATTITRTNYNQMYYSAAQQLTHHASSGCAMQPGDLIGSGTISGPKKHEHPEKQTLNSGVHAAADHPRNRTRQVQSSIRNGKSHTHTHSHTSGSEGK